MRLLLVEDTADMAEAIVASFARRGDAIDHVTTRAAAEDALAVGAYDVLILDIGLPDGAGTDLLRGLRARANPLPVLMLTARAEIEDRVAALDSGADDYLTKPFDLRELQARVRAMARRGRDGPDRAATIAYGDLLFDGAGQTVTLGGAPLALARREFSLLEILLADRGRVVPKERILARMFSFSEEEVNVNAVELYTARLRRKLRGSQVTIRTLRGLGYQLVCDG